MDCDLETHAETNISCSRLTFVSVFYQSSQKKTNKYKVKNCCISNKLHKNEDNVLGKVLNDLKVIVVNRDRH